MADFAVQTLKPGANVARSLALVITFVLTIPTAVIAQQLTATEIVEGIETEIVEWGNLFGGEWQSNRAVAVFSLEGAKALTPDDVDVALIITAGEFRCKIGKKDRARLFSPNR